MDPLRRAQNAHAMSKKTTQAEQLTWVGNASEAARLCGVSRAHWFKMHAMGKVPAPVRLGPRVPRWRFDELRAWLDAGCPDRLTWERMRRGQ